MRLIFNVFYRAIKYVIPYARFGDWLYGYILFINKHKRLPTNKSLFNDVLFKIKTSSDLSDPLRVFVTDKEYLKLYVKTVIGDQYNVPTIDIVRNKEEVSCYKFPDECVIKPTHLSGKIIVRKNNDAVSVSEIESRRSNALSSALASVD